MSDIATPEMIAAAWDAWKSRPGWKLGPGPGFREAIEAALSVRSKEPELEHHVIADLAARLAKAERALEEAEKVIKPFAAIAPVFDSTVKPSPQRDGDTVYAWETARLGHLEMTVGHLRAARKWMESRHD